MAAGRQGGEGHGPPRPKRYDLSHDILRLASRCAVWAGLEGADAEDCAEEFLQIVLLDASEERLRPPEACDATGTLHDPWVTRAALHHALNCRRRLRRVGLREAPMPEETTSGAFPFGHATDAEAAMMRGIAREALQTALEALEPGPREMVQLFHFQGHSIAQIARTTRRSEHAVQEALRRARGRLRSELVRHGWDGDELRFHLADTPDGD